MIIIVVRLGVQSPGMAHILGVKWSERNTETPVNMLCRGHIAGTQGPGGP